MRAAASEAGVRGRDIARLLWQHSDNFVRRRMAGVIGLVIAAGILNAIGPLALKFMVDGLSSKPGGFVIPLSIMTLYVLALWLGRTAQEARELVFARARQRVLRALSERLFCHLMHLPLRFHLDRQTGGVSQTLENGLEGARIILHQLVFTLLPVAVELLAVLLVLVRVVTAPFVVVFCSAALCYLLAFCYAATAVRASARGASAARIRAASVMTDGLLNYEIIKCFTAESFVQARVAVALTRAESEAVRFYRQDARNGIVMASFFAAFLGGTIYFAAAELRRGSMTLGDFVLVNTYMLQIVRPVEMMGYAMQGMASGVAMLEGLVRLFRERGEAELRMGEERVTGAGCLEFRDVCLAYERGRPVLNDVSFRLSAGHTLGIVGPSGSGKSTIVRLLMRLLEPQSGSILLDGVPISGIALQELRRSVAVVPQDTVLFDDTLRYNIAFGRADANSEEVEEAAKVAQLHELIRRLPDQYDTRVGERGAKLSGGERQRVSIARAVLKRPRIYAFDEATSSLDSRTEREILRNLRSMSRFNTTLVIAHRLLTVVHADEIIMLENGRITERGTHDSLLRQNGGYAAMWKVQQGGSAAA